MVQDWEEIGRKLIRISFMIRKRGFLDKLNYSIFLGNAIHQFVFSLKIFQYLQMFMETTCFEKS
jgi:hypothetical protein